MEKEPSVIAASAKVIINILGKKGRTQGKTSGNACSFLVWRSRVDNLFIIKLVLNSPSAVHVCFL